MSPASFRTRKRLWAIISAILFIAPWFFVLSYKSGDKTAWKMVAAALRSGHPSEALEVIGGFTLLLAPPALAVGWLIHWLVVTLANGTKTDRRNLAPATQR